MLQQAQVALPPLPVKVCHPGTSPVVLLAEG